MKKTGMFCMMGMCLAMLSFATTSPDRDWEWIRTNDKERFDRLWKEYNDPLQLKAFFERSVLISRYNEREMANFKRSFGIKEETLRTMLMEIIREASAKTRWEWRFDMDEPRDIRIASRQLDEAISWLGVCADAETKQFLLDIATDGAKPERYRSGAIYSYMRCADAQEIRDGIARIFSDDVRAALPADDFYSNAYSVAIWHYDNAADDTQKREAIIISLTAALTKEEDKRTFTRVDKLLAERSKAYADSPQRKAALERLNIPIEKGGQ